jgi:Putative zinc-finger
VTQQEHLTTEQLSAFLDKQLPPQEQAFFDAHLQSCQRCQGVLEELRRTVVLLHAMPQPQLPRSFTLPAGISQIRVAQPQPAQQRRVLPYTLRRTMRAVSTLAAAIAVIFILSGLLANYHPASNTGTAASSGPIYNTANGTTAHAPVTQPSLTQASRTKSGTPIGTPKASSATTTPIPTPTPTPTSSKGLTTHGTLNPVNPPTLPPFLDIGQPEGRLTLGGLLLLLSIVGIITTRRRRDTVS